MTSKVLVSETSCKVLLGERFATSFHIVCKPTHIGAGFAQMCKSETELNHAVL